MSENQAAATTTTAAASTAMESARKWVVENKLKTVGCLWLSGVTGSFAYNWSQPAMKTSVKIIHARLHAQALTLAALAGAAVVEYYDRQHGSKAQQRQGKGFSPPLRPTRTEGTGGGYEPPMPVAPSCNQNPHLIYLCNSSDYAQ